ncbi:MAG: tyrosine-type recombinase/integrase [Xylanivirga thermophila]|jgi:integrase/recombinase XerD|uniref:tyrosine-type recombinase/integrase n=1 Tax=Xylanivirga thermophila TaxID=2496273 RepID=UPI00101D5033|nr:tyrosine-type recombinase/integrase [Xylanivirga thermophila]
MNEEIIKEYERYLYYKGKSINTVDTYIRSIKGFMCFIDKDLLSVKQLDIDEYKSYLRRKKCINGGKLSPKTINIKLLSLSSFYEFVEQKKKIFLPISIELIKIQKVYYLETAIINVEDFYNLVDSAQKNEDLRAISIFYTLFLTGMRVSEILQLTVDDINRKEISIVGKGGKVRNVYMADELSKILTEYVDKQRINKSDMLFTGERGPITRQTVNRIIKKYARIAGVALDKSHAHAFRHLYAKEAVNSGRYISDIADELGHSSLDTTRIYTRKTKEEKYRELNKYLNSKVK